MGLPLWCIRSVSDGDLNNVSDGEGVVWSIVAIEVPVHPLTHEGTHLTGTKPRLHGTTQPTFRDVSRFLLAPVAMITEPVFRCVIYF